MIATIMLDHPFDWEEAHTDDVTMAQPGRVRRPPSRFADFVSH